MGRIKWRLSSVKRKCDQSREILSKKALGPAKGLLRLPKINRAQEKVISRPRSSSSHRESRGVRREAALRPDTGLLQPEKSHASVHKKVEAGR